jgi:hypothetical protein
MSVDIRLPASAQSILTRHEKQDRDRFTQYNARAAEIRNLKDQLAETTARRAELADYDRRGKLYRESVAYDDDGKATRVRTPDASALKQLDAQIDSLRAQIKESEAAKFLNIKTAVVLKRDLASYMDEEFTDADRPRLQLLKSERPQDALLRYRAEIASLREERKAVVALPSTLAEAKQRAHAQIDRIAKVPLVRNCFQESGSIEFAEHRLAVDANNIAKYLLPDALGLVAYLMGDELKSRIDRLLEINADDSGISARDREKYLAEIDDKLANLDALDCACVETITAEGGTAFHRPDADAFNVLGIAVVEF